MSKTAAKKSAKAPTKSEVLNNIAAATKLSRKEVSSVLEALANEVKKNLSNRGPGVFAIPGLVKIIKKRVPARPAKKGVPNPFKPGELMDVAARPAGSCYTGAAGRALSFDGHTAPRGSRYHPVPAAVNEHNPRPPEMLARRGAPAV